MAFVSDQHDVESGCGKAPGFGVHLGHERAGRIDHVEPTLLRLNAHRRRDTVGREDHRLTRRHLVQLVDEDRATLLERAHDVNVVNDLLAYVNRCPAILERPLDDLDRAFDTRARRPR